MTDIPQQEAAAPQEGGAAAPRAGAARARLARVAATAASLAIVAVVPLFLAFSNTQIKELVDRFTGGCVFVIDKAGVGGGQVYVTAQIAGVMPRSIPLIFATRDAMLNTILFEDAYAQSPSGEPDDLAFHPMTEQSCPGALCAEYGMRPLHGQVQITLTDLRPEFTYRFRVGLRTVPGAAAATAANLKVYAEYDRGLDGGVCRIQPRRWFNFWVWAGPLGKSMLFVGIIVVGGLLLKWSKVWG